MSTDDDREAWVNALLGRYVEAWSQSRSVGVAVQPLLEKCAEIAAEQAEHLARLTEARTLSSMMPLAGRLAAAMASEDAEAIEGVEDEFRVSIDIPKTALPWREAMEPE